MNKTRYSATEFGGNKPMNFRPSGTLTIGSCLACVHRVMDARGKFGEHERSVRVARGAAESNSSFLNSSFMNQLFYNIASGNVEIVIFRKVPQFYFASVETVNYKQYESVRR